MTADAQSPITSTVLENRRHVQSWSNGTDENIVAMYEETEKYGHAVSARLKGRVAHFEAEVGYSFTYENMTRHSTQIIVPARKNVVVYEYDKRVKWQYVDVKSMKQRWALWWKDTDQWHWEDETIKEYSGNHIEVSYF